MVDVLAARRAQLAAQKNKGDEAKRQKAIAMGLFSKQPWEDQRSPERGPQVPSGQGDLQGSAGDEVGLPERLGTKQLVVHQPNDPEPQAGFLDPKGITYTKQSGGRGLGNALGAAGDFAAMLPNALIQAGRNIATGKPGEPYFPSVSQGIRDTAAKVSGERIIPDEEVTPGTQLAGKGLETTVGVVADPMNLVGAGAAEEAASAAGKLTKARPALEAANDAGTAERLSEGLPEGMQMSRQSGSRPRPTREQVLAQIKKKELAGKTYDPYAIRKPERGELDKILSGTTNKGGVVKGSAVMPKEMPKSTPQNFPMPALASPENRAMIDKIFEHAKEERSPMYDLAQNPIFGPADPKLTKELVPQQSIAGILPPKPTGESPLPANDRARPILQNEKLIGERLARTLQESPHADNPLPFYSTGSVIQGLVDKGGLSLDDALAWMHNWAGQGAATSPRTATPQNLRNAMYLLFRNASGDRLTKAQQKFEQSQAMHGFPKTHNQPKKSGDTEQAVLNRPGFAMMGMHTQLGDEFFKGTVDPYKNPKPYTFQQNWKGNMADVTADTHNIRGTLIAYDQLDPGGIPRGWFKTDEGYRRYVEAGGFPDEGEIDVGAIEDGLKGATQGGRYAQTEYPIMQGPTAHAAEIMGISPAEAQERLWFDLGSRTGLRSPRLAIPDLLNSQIEKTAKILGISPEEVLRLVSKHRIPLAANEPLNIPGESAVG